MNSKVVAQPLRDPTFVRLQQTWETLGREDPLWAVFSRPDKRGGRWKADEFLATGESEVAHLRELLRQHAQAPTRFEHVFDFGCGAGRLTLAWSHHAGRVTGVDISEPMISLAQEFSRSRPNISYLVNTRPDLAVLADGSFDLCFSMICLQHIPWEIAKCYLQEFGRLCAPGGWVLFQLPAQPASSGWAARCRRTVVEGLPFGLAGKYRRWRHGSSAVFDVYFTPRETVLRAATAAGLQPLHQEPDQSAGEGTQGWLYFFRKPAR